MSGRHLFGELTMDFTPERRTCVDARKAELRAAMRLHELRQARAMTRKAVGDVLEVNDGLRPVVDARLYPNELMTDFNLELENWIRDGRALKYFRERDGDAILPIQEITAALPPPSEDGS